MRLYFVKYFCVLGAKIDSIIFQYFIGFCMSELDEAIHKMRLSEDRGAFRSEITRVDSLSRFSSGWISHNFLYETPDLFITCETEFGGEIQIEIPVNDFSESVLSRFLKDAEVFDIEEGVDVESLVGETIFVATGESNNNATIGWDSDVEYDDERSAILRSDNLLNAEYFEVNGNGLEPKSSEWMNELLTNSYYRHKFGTHGWIEVNFEYVGKSNDKYFFAAELLTGKQIYWSFDADMQGVDNVRSFLSELGLDFTPNEFGSEYVWVKPVREIHHTNRPSKEANYLIDTEESFVASKEPLAPYNDEKKTIIERIKNFFSLFIMPRNNSVMVSATSSSTYRRANSSQTRDTVTPDMTELSEGESVENELLAERN